MYQALIDFVVADEDSYTLRAIDCREHARCQGRIIQTRRNSHLVVRWCNELCTLKNASYERIKELEDDMSKIVQRSIQIEEEISALKSIDRRLLPTDSRAKYQYSERTLKLLKAAEQHSSNQKFTGYPAKTKSAEEI